jgi:hypothetical protein
MWPDAKMWRSGVACHDFGAAVAARAFHDGERRGECARTVDVRARPLSLAGKGGNHLRLCLAHGHPISERIGGQRDRQRQCFLKLQQKPALRRDVVGYDADRSAVTTRE